MVDEHWDADMLMGTTGPEAGKGGAAAVKQDPMLWGRAGHFTPEQVECYVSLLQTDFLRLLLHCIENTCTVVHERSQMVVVVHVDCGTRWHNGSEAFHELQVEQLYCNYCLPSDIRLSRRIRY